MVATMRNKLLAKFFTIVGFLSSLVFPIWGVSMQVQLLRESGDGSMLETIGLTASGFVIVAFLVVLTIWRFFAERIRKKLKPQRTLIGFFGIGYMMLLAVKMMMDSLENIFLFGTIGAATAVVCYFIADLLRGGN